MKILALAIALMLMSVLAGCQARGLDSGTVETPQLNPDLAASATPVPSHFPQDLIYSHGIEAPYPETMGVMSGQLAAVYDSVESIARSALVIVTVRIESIEFVAFDEVPFTVSTAVVEVSSKGSLALGERITVVETGGVFAGRSKIEPGARGEPVEAGWEGVPVMKPGERYLLFLHGPAHVGPVPSSAYSVKGVVQGKIRIGKDGRLQFTGRAESLDEPIFAVPRALVGRPYSDVRAEVEAIIRR